MRRRGRVTAAALAVEGTILATIGVLVCYRGSNDMRVGMALITLTLAMMGTMTWYLAGRAYPAEEAFELGYQAGLRDGRRSQTLSVVRELREVG